MKDRKLASIFRRLRDLPGYELFQYTDDESRHHSVDSSDFNEYLKEVSGEDFTAKDFRAWAGTVAATRALEELGEPENATQAKHNVASPIKEAAARLGNTPAICRTCYVHPSVINTYLDGTHFREERTPTPAEVRSTGLSSEEARVLARLRRIETVTDAQQARAS